MNLAERKSLRRWGSVFWCVWSHDARFHVLVDALVMVMKLMVVRPAAAGMKRGDPVQVQHEVLPVAHRS